MKHIFYLLVVFFLAGCSGTDGVDVKSASLQGVEATIREDVAVGSTLSGELYIRDAPYNLADVIISIMGEGSEDFSVEVAEGVSTDTFVGTITLLHSLMGKAGSSYNLTATATLGGHNLSAPIDISILEAKKENQPPTININEENQTLEVGSTITLTTSANDPDEDTLTYQWQIKKNNSNYINSVTTNDFQHKFDQVGVFLIKVLATDGNGGEASDLRMITVANPPALAPSLSGIPKTTTLWQDSYTFIPINSGGIATFEIINKPSWATFDTANGVLNGTPTLSDLGVTSDINITAVNEGGSSFLNLFNIEVAKRTPPTIESGEAKNLNLDVFNFSFSDDALWREHITKVSFIRGYGESAIVLGGGDYTLSEGNFALKVKDSDKVALHSAIEGGCEVRFEADGYLDNSILIGIVGGGTNVVKLQITPQTPLIETNLDNAKIDITLLNQLKFADSTLDKSKFTLLGTPEGVSILSVSYINQTSALLTLSFNESDFDENKTISLSIAPDELNVNQTLNSNTVQITAVVEDEPTLIVPNFLSSLPIDDSKNIAVTSKVEFSLDQDMSDILLELSSCSLTNMDSYATVDLSLSYAGKKLILTPSSNLKYNHPYIAQCSITYDGTTKSSETISFDTKELFIPLMKTGITKSYDKDGVEDLNIKDDGYYRKGRSINRARDGNITSDLITGLDWNDDGFMGTRTVSSAKFYCRLLTAGDFDDWRLPTAKELQSLMIYDGTEAKDIDHFVNLKHLEYWSSTKAVESSSSNGDSYMIIKFPDFITDELETQGNHILCVRKR